MAPYVQLKLIKQQSPLEALIGYVTDAKEVFATHAGWFAERHREGAAFAEVLVGAGKTVLEQAGVTSKEQGEARAATSLQGEALEGARALAREIRRRGKYLVSELERTGHEADHKAAMKVRVATGIGTKVNLQRHNGLRRLMSTQLQGLPVVADVFAEWSQPADLLERLTAALAELEGAMTTQAKEQIEADIACDQLEALVGETIDTFNRALRLVNNEPDTAPEALVTALASVQSSNPDVFWRPVEPEDEPDEVEPAEPDTEG